MKKICVSIISILLVLTFFSSCNQDAVSIIDNGKLTVVTTAFPIYDWTSNVAGDSCNVIYLDESGTDMHSFEPTANDILTISQADVFVHIGGVSDEWVRNAVDSAANDKLITVSLMDYSDLRFTEAVEGMEHNHGDHEHDISEYDEHIWLSLKNAQKCVTAICDAMCTADSGNTAVYRKNAQDYISKLSQLDSAYQKCVNEAERKTLLFADRFPFIYLTKDYGIEYYAAFPGCSAESEASFETLAFLIEKTNELSLPCILTVENSDSDIAGTVSGETGAEIRTLNSCQSVTKADIEAGLTYISAMENNLKVITEALN